MAPSARSSLCRVRGLLSWARMNGISFSDFENSSFDSLYSRGFANARHGDEVAKNMKPGDWAMQLGPSSGMPNLPNFEPGTRHSRQNGERQRVPAAPASQAPRAVQPSQQRHMATHIPDRGFLDQNIPMMMPADRSVPSRSRAVPARQPTPLNDMGVMPDSTRVDHTWKPSREAAARVLHAPQSHALEAPRGVSGAPANSGGQQGTFVSWKTN
ncbi:unnamed protein product [Polarella glacialis]|uniref:Uncharacterized protein n=1 Tax=Polarella glacialis TaxID=89957 RepID=A0A813DFL6_POLGL|nr:unnamed protein product [Polarella glacialis]CAE8666608.1 unnamed protein product [Polarella glacialis]